MARRTIPIQVDSIKTQENFKRTRFVYYRIEFESGPVISTRSSRLKGGPLYSVWGSWAVLTGPGPSGRNHKIFDSRESIQDTIANLEENEELFLDLGHFWIPNELLGSEANMESIKNGDVYRISVPLFQECYRFAAETISQERWLESCLSMARQLKPSPDESAAFRNWRQDQIKRSSERYHHADYASLRLPKKGNEK